MLLASGWSGPAKISFAPDLSGNDPSSGSSRFLGRCSEMRCCEKQKQRDFLYSTTWSVSMQYQAQISDHSTLGNCFHRCRRSYKCHLWRHLAAHIRRRMSAGIPGIYPKRDKTGDFSSFFTNRLYRRLYGLGHELALQHTNVRKRWFYHFFRDVTIFKDAADKIFPVKNWTESAK